MLQKETINNELYKNIGNNWYIGNDYVALLRAESKTRNPWIIKNIKNHFQNNNVNVIDVGCGGGLLANELSNNGFQVTGIDICEEALQVARQYDQSKNVNYIQANAINLPFASNNFDVVCATDLLEHVDNYQSVLEECIRVLKINGLIFFHTFNRNTLSKYIVIKGVEWFVKNTPRNLHVYSLFIKPNELISSLSNLGCVTSELLGLSPKIFSKSFLSLLLKGEVDEEFSFQINKSLLTGYMGIAVKKNIF